MKSLIKAVAVASVLVAPAISFAQTNQPETRADVRAQLIQLEQAGYNPARRDPQYPADIQAAEERVNAEHGVTPQAPVADTSGYGAAMTGSSQSGDAGSTPQQRNVYFGN
ncbi:DUF4148 domain-containing protein [Paraburkholderia saeva]|jgi:Domain of unknown function (DUF4148)|uniref:DUF4148 domain-containing protein n=1 Tax=Paraburkholderia saeva TaxID=2777537 RepID=A0A9N8RVY1_9BURK|nr:DUF4148 domain-containing protein [Paraburkholderia saeva]CAG4888713.1 hypothetical protein R52603_00748 [Paraburkholderia saeva]CAG4893736.1 hypothetical protein R70241_01632 [Paraburkholderia saeva]CAG4896106.1 hypothetical protein LMG31841_02293 [Paraburkholderia saeva]